MVQKMHCPEGPSGHRSIYPPENNCIHNWAWLKSKDSQHLHKCPENSGTFKWWNIHRGLNRVRNCWNRWWYLWCHRSVNHCWSTRKLLMQCWWLLVNYRPWWWLRVLTILNEICRESVRMLLMIKRTVLLSVCLSRGQRMSTQMPEPARISLLGFSRLKIAYTIDAAFPWNCSFSDPNRSGNWISLFATLFAFSFGFATTFCWSRCGSWTGGLWLTIGYLRSRLKQWCHIRSQMRHLMQGIVKSKFLIKDQIVNHLP